MAEELAQETFQVAYRDWDRISGLDNPRAWVRKVAINLRDGCSASIWSAPEGSSLLTLDGPSVQTAPEGSRRIVWMIKRMIKGCPTESDAKASK